MSIYFQESRGKRPLKVWDSLRSLRKGLVVGSFEELLVRGSYFMLFTNLSYIPPNIEHTRLSRRRLTKQTQHLQEI